jgi:dUTP pyrophosphatase
VHRKIETRIVSPLLGDKIPLPTYATPGSAAMDLRACITTPVTLEPGKNAVIMTGLAINMMDPGLVAVVASRSGLALKNQIIALNAPGIVDSDFHGEIGVILANLGSETYVVQPGERIAQLLFQPVVQVDFHYVDQFSIKTERGTGGFGSTGKN